MVISEREKIIETINRLFINTDNRNWTAVRNIFAPSVLFDMTSMAGGKPSKLTSQEIVDGWDKGLKALEAIHHQAGNYLVDVKGSEATVFCYGIAFHYLPNRSNRNTRTFVGSYDIHLIKQKEDWKIDRFKFNLKYLDGNKELEAS